MSFESSPVCGGASLQSGGSKSARFEGGLCPPYTVVPRRASPKGGGMCRGCPNLRWWDQTGVFVHHVLAGVLSQRQYLQHAPPKCHAPAARAGSEMLCFSATPGWLKFVLAPQTRQVESAHPSQEEVDSACPRGADGESKATGGGGGVAGGRPSVLPAPILEPVMPARTRLQEAGAEVAVYYSQIEGQVIFRLDLVWLGLVLWVGGGRRSPRVTISASRRSAYLLPSSRLVCKHQHAQRMPVKNALWQGPR